MVHTGLQAAQQASIPSIQKVIATYADLAPLCLCGGKHLPVQEEAARRREERFGSDGRAADQVRHSRDQEDPHRRPRAVDDRRRPAEPSEGRRR